MNDIPPSKTDQNGRDSTTGRFLSGPNALPEGDAEAIATEYRQDQRPPRRHSPQDPLLPTPQPHDARLPRVSTRPDYFRLPEFFADEHLSSVIAHVGQGGTVLDWCAYRDHESKRLEERPDKDRPQAWTVGKWLRDPVNADFNTAYFEAREIGYDALAARALRIARTPHPMTSVDEYQDIDEDGNATTNSRKTHTEDSIAHRKLEIDTTMRREWI